MHSAHAHNDEHDAYGDRDDTAAPVVGSVVAPTNPRAAADRDALRLIVATPAGAQRDRLIDDFMRERDEVFRKRASSYVTHFKVDRNTWFDDFASVTREAAYKIITECEANPAFIDQIGSYEALMTDRARKDVRRFVESSSGMSFATGMTTMRRRRDELERTREQLAALLTREPSDDEIVEKTNERLLATRKDAKNENMLATVADLHTQGWAEDIADPYNAHATGVVDDHEGDGVLHRVERVAVAKATIEAAQSESVTVGRVATLWMSTWMSDEPGEPPAPLAIADELNLSPTTVRNSIKRTRAICAELLAASYGVYGVNG